MKVIVINGPMGVGKTAAGKCIAEKYPGTAFIDGDWCMDLHPFVGNRETRAMAVDNILHMIGNYLKCSACKMVVLAWLMDDPQVMERITGGLAEMQAEAVTATLVCDSETLISRWHNDHLCPWRTEKWLKASLASLPFFSSREDAIDTTGASVEQAAAMIMGDRPYPLQNHHDADLPRGMLL